jgi:hypothetical protein
MGKGNGTEIPEELKNQGRIPIRVPEAGKFLN